MKVAASYPETVQTVQHKRNPFICLLVFACSLATSLSGENAACLSRTVLVGVSGEPSEGWTTADFKVAVGGKPASIQSVTPADRPPRVLILLDVSANHDQSTWAAAREMVDEFMAGFPLAADLTLVTFDDKVQRVVHETDRAALQGTVGEMFPSGKRESEAGLSQAIKEANVGFAVHRQGDAELLITTSDRTNKEILQALSQQVEAGIRLFGGSFDQSKLPDPFPYGGSMTAEDYTPLEAVAKTSGGAWIRFDMRREESRNATAAGKTTAALVRNYVVLELRLTSPVTKPEKLKIELVKSVKGKAQERFPGRPQELFPCQ
jgi:hypothetical protein